MRVNLSLSFPWFSFSEGLWEVSSLAGNFWGVTWATEMDFLNFSCNISGFDRKTKIQPRFSGNFLFFCLSLRHCKKSSKSPSPWPKKNFPPKRILLRDLQKTKIMENSKTNWPALAFSQSGGSSSHKVKKTFWNFFEIFRKIKILYKNAFLFKGLEFWNILFLKEHR